MILKQGNTDPYVNLGMGNGWGFDSPSIILILERQGQHPREVRVHK